MKKSVKYGSIRRIVLVCPKGGFVRTPRPPLATPLEQPPSSEFEIYGATRDFFKGEYWRWYLAYNKFCHRDEGYNSKSLTLLLKYRGKQYLITPPIYYSASPSIVNYVRSLEASISRINLRAAVFITKNIFLEIITFYAIMISN